MEITLQTERLMLKPLRSIHAPGLYRLWSDPVVTEYLDISALPSEDRACRIVDLLKEREQKGEGIRFGIFPEGSDRLIGTCGFNSLLKRRGNHGEIGYDLAPAYWGKGCMSEALGALIKHGFDTLELNRIEALVLPANTKSVQLLVRLGFTQEGLLRQRGFWKGQYWDLLMFSLLAR